MCLKKYGNILLLFLLVLVPQFLYSQEKPLTGEQRQELKIIIENLKKSNRMLRIQLTEVSKELTRASEDLKMMKKIFDEQRKFLMVRINEISRTNFLENLGWFGMGLAVDRGISLIFKF